MYRLLHPIILIGFLTLSFFQLSAQSNPKADQMLARMESEFSLTTEQSTEVRGVLDQTITDMQAIRSLRQTDKRAFRQQKQAIMKDMESSILAILDETQAAQFEAMRANSQKKQRRQQAAMAGSQAKKQGKVQGANGQEMGQEGGEDMLEKTLDFLYEGFLRPAVQKRNRRN